MMTSKTKKNILLFLVCSALAAWNACKKDDDLVALPQPLKNEPEVITTLKLSFTDSANTGNVRVATFRDPDGDGGAAYDIFDTIRLQANKTWFAKIVLLNEAVTPADTMSKEVAAEKNDHLFCFTPSGSSASVSITDRDGNNLPLGLLSTWRTGAAGNGFMRVELKHQVGTKTGACSPGETDIQVNFPVKIQ
jgi:hypothetical protein